jgi:FkbM family methyltransferase
MKPVDIARNYISEGSNVIDIGAFSGGFCIPISKHIGDKGYIYAFEPIPEQFDIINTKIKKEKLSNIRLEQKAIWDKSEYVLFEVSRKKSSSSFAQKFIQNHKDRNIAGFDDPESYKIKIKTVKFTEYFTDQKIDFIKCDAQGTDFDIIYSAHDFIDKNRPTVFMEYTNFAYEEGTNEILYKMFNKMNYTLYGNIGSQELFPLNNPDSLNKVWDILAVPSGAI